MITLAPMPVLKVKLHTDLDIKGIDHNKYYPVVGTIMKMLPEKDNPSVKRAHDQIVIISDTGKWLEIYPGHCDFSVIEPFKVDK
jgi:hypothetical protein